MGDDHALRIQRTFCRNQHKRLEFLVSLRRGVYTVADLDSSHTRMSLCFLAVG